MSYRLHPTKNKTPRPDGLRHWIIVVSQGRKKTPLYFPHFGDEASAMAEDKRLNDLLKGNRTTAECTIASKLPEYATYYKTIATSAIVTDMLSVMKRCLIPAFGKLTPGQVVGPLVSSYTLKRLETISPKTHKPVTHRTIQKELNYLSAMVKWMKKNGFAQEIREIDRPPSAKCKPQKIIQPLTIDELSRFTLQLPPDRQALALLMSDAGLRMKEALPICCQDIDLASGRVLIKGKGNKQVMYPILTRRLFEALEREKGDRTTGWLVVNPDTDKPYGSIKTLFRLAAKRAGIQKPVTHHVLRHTYSTVLMELEIPAEVRQKLMRHSTLSATEHYTHVSPEWMEKQAGKFSTMVDQLAKPVKTASTTQQSKIGKKTNNHLRLVK